MELLNYLINYSFKNKNNPRGSFSVNFRQEHSLSLLKEAIENNHHQNYVANSMIQQELSNKKNQELINYYKMIEKTFLWNYFTRNEFEINQFKLNSTFGIKSNF